MKIKLIFIACLLVLALCIFPVIGESGLFESSQYSQIAAKDTGSYTALIHYAGSMVNLTTTDISYAQGVDFISVQCNPNSAGCVMNNNGLGNGSSTRFTSAYGDGEIGYQMIYSGTSYAASYAYVLFDEPINTTQTGAKIIYLNYDPSEIQDLRIGAIMSQAGVKDTATNNPMLGFGATISGHGTCKRVDYYQNVYNNVNRSFKNSWFAELGGIGARGRVNKTIDTVPYYSKAYIYDLSETLLASESAFNNNDFEFNVFNYPLYIRVLSNYGTWHNTSLILSGAESRILTVNPSAITLGQNISLTLSNMGSVYPEYIFYWDFDDPTRSSTITSIAKYKHITGTTWQKFINGAWASSGENAYAPPEYKPITTGNHSIHADIYNIGGTTTTLIKYVNITDATASGVLMHLGAMDGSTGGHLSNYYLKTTRIRDGFARNDSVVYELDFSMISGEQYSMQGFKQGYIPSNIVNFTAPFLTGTFSNYQYVQMYVQGTNLDIYNVSVPDGGLALNSSVYYTVKDKLTNMPIQNALIVQNYYNYDLHTQNVKNGYTNAQGKLMLLIPFNSTGSIQITKEGYISASDFLSTSKTYTLEKEILLMPSSSISTITPTITPTNIITIPTTSYIQVDGGIIINGSICKNPQGPLEILDYAVCTSGMPKNTDRGLLYAIILIFGLAAVLGWITRESNGGIGMMFGGVIGFVFSVILGWIPLFWVIVFVLLGVVIIFLLARQGG